MELHLEGKRALVTGSSSGIGVAIAEMLAAEGAAVVVHGRDVGRAEAVAARIRASGGRCGVACGDLTTDEGAADIASAARAAFDGVDILVNNAGGTAEVEDRSWFGAGAAVWMGTYQRNVLGAVRLIHALAPEMKARGWGRIINIGTAAGTTPTSGQPDYGPSKAAMLNMSLGLSKALGKTGVTSNCVSPGMIRTEGLVAFLAAFAKRRGWGDDLARAEAYIADGGGQTVTRIGEVGDIAYVVAMLASPRADFINGANFHVDGGISPSIY
jgi:3-oxoacyl-[acyl-carrier protein] reductase